MLRHGVKLESAGVRSMDIRIAERKQKAEMEELPWD